MAIKLRAVQFDGAPPGEPHADLFHDWNVATVFPFAPRLVDETLRDGLQSPSACDPPVEKKIELLHRMVRLGIDCAALGFPASRAQQYDDALALAREVRRARLPIQVCCAARTLPADIAPIAEISQRAGMPIEVGMFLGSSPIRQLTEGWGVDTILELTERAIRFAVAEGLVVMFVTEDSTRSQPHILEQLYATAIRHGARRVCIADTVGQATPSGAASLVRFVRGVVEACDPDVRIDWHGHRDRGFELANCFAAWEAGAERCHGTALGIGERTGNTPIELLLVNLLLAGHRATDLSSLPAYVRSAAAALGFTAPPHHPVVGRDAFRTATGTHAAALVKAQALGDDWLSNRIYSSVPAELVGRRQVIDVGPCSGEANVEFWLRRHGIEPTPEYVRDVLELAKHGDRVLDEHEILELCGADHEPSGLHTSEQQVVSELPAQVPGQRRG